MAQSVELASLPEADEIISIESLTSLFQQTHNEAIRLRTLEVLDQILSLGHRDTADFPSLVECQSQAQDLWDAIAETAQAELSTEVRDLGEGNHPFAALLTLVENVGEIQDAEWESLYDTVSRSFDRSLSTALVRQKLYVKEKLPDSPAQHEDPVAEESVQERDTQIHSVVPHLSEVYADGNGQRAWSMESEKRALDRQEPPSVHSPSEGGGGYSAPGFRPTAAA